MNESRVPLKLGGVYKGYNDITITITDAGFYEYLHGWGIEFKNSQCPTRFSYIRLENWNNLVETYDLHPLAWVRVRSSENKIEWD